MPWQLKEHWPLLAFLTGVVLLIVLTITATRLGLFLFFAALIVLHLANYFKKNPDWGNVLSSPQHAAPVLIPVFLLITLALTFLYPILGLRPVFTWIGAALLALSAAAFVFFLVQQNWPRGGAIGLGVGLAFCALAGACVSSRSAVIGPLIALAIALPFWSGAAQMALSGKIGAGIGFFCVFGTLAGWIGYYVATRPPATRAEAAQVWAAERNWEWLGACPAEVAEQLAAVLPLRTRHDVERVARLREKDRTLYLMDYCDRTGLGRLRFGPRHTVVAVVWDRPALPPGRLDIRQRLSTFSKLLPGGDLVNAGGEAFQNQFEIRSTAPDNWGGLVADKLEPPLLKSTASQKGLQLDALVLNESLLAARFCVKSAGRRGRPQLALLWNWIDWARHADAAVQSVRELADTCAAP